MTVDDPGDRFAELAYELKGLVSLDRACGIRDELNELEDAAEAYDYRAWHDYLVLKTNREIRRADRDAHLERESGSVGDRVWDALDDIDWTGAHPTRTKATHDAIAHLGDRFAGSAAPTAGTQERVHYERIARVLAYAEQQVERARKQERVQERERELSDQAHEREQLRVRTYQIVEHERDSAWRMEMNQ